MIGVDGALEPKIVVKRVPAKNIASFFITLSNTWCKNSYSLKVST